MPTLPIPLNLWPEGADQAPHVTTAHTLNPEPYVDLFEIWLPDVGETAFVYLSSREEVQWDGKTWEALSCELTGTTTNTTGQAVRPSFQVLNPEGLYSLYVAQGGLDNATVTRYRVLRTHLDQGIVTALKYSWAVGRVTNLTKVAVTLELRAFYDGHKFRLPVREYIPPEFTHVSLG